MNSMNKKIIVLLMIVGIILCAFILNIGGTPTPEPPQPPPAIKKLKIEDIIGNICITVVIKNVGNVDISDITLNCDDVDCIIEIFPQKQFNIPLLHPDESTEVFIPIFDIGAGEVIDPLEIWIEVSANELNTLERTVFAGVYGPFVMIYGMYFNDGGSFDGYTLFTPYNGINTYLLNDDGEFVQKWNSQLFHLAGTGVYLLENGNLLRAEWAGLIDFLKWDMGGGTGRVDMFDWDGNLIWWYEYVSDTYCLHNDIEPLPNGNILMIAYNIKTDSEADNAGRNPEIDDGDMLIDYIIEVEPTSPGEGNIVWEWHAWDHLIQDYDSTKDNYGVVADHPELIDFNIPRERGSGEKRDFLHLNSLEYYEEFDQILISSRNLNEIWVIDHSTTIEEAAGHTGGNYGKGGDLLYRWGNPENYDRGDKNDQQLFQQHDARWIESGCPGEGHITIFNNGWGRHDGADYTSVIEIVPPVDSNGYYYLEPGNNPYGPVDIYWEWEDERKYDFYSEFCGSAQRLPNGNTLICDGWEKGKIFEVTPQNEIIWCYTNLLPIPGLEKFHSVFKVQRYPLDYPGIGEFTSVHMVLSTEMEYVITSNPNYGNYGN